MNKYNRTHLVVLTVLALLTLASLPANAQNGNTKSNRAAAVLTIKVNLVPTVQLPRMQHQNPESPVTYNLPAERPDLDVIEETRLLSAAVSGKSAKGEGAVLKTLTIVVH